MLLPSLTESAARTPMSQFSHFDESGASRMVDVGGKDVTERIARAVAYVTLAPEPLILIRDGKVLKGNVFEVAHRTLIHGEGGRQLVEAEAH